MRTWIAPLLVLGAGLAVTPGAAQLQPEFVAAWGERGAQPGALNHPRGIAIAPHGRLYVADTDNHRVQFFDYEGNLLAVWGRFGTAAGEFRSPDDLLIANDRLYVVDSNNQMAPGARRR